MEKKKQTREEALRRFKASKERKKNFLNELEKRMRKEYKEETGTEALRFSVL